METTLTAQKVVKIAMFDDCIEVLDHYNNLFKAMDPKIEFEVLRSPAITAATLARLREFNPSLIITNLMLRESAEDGFVLMTVLRNYFPEVPIVVLSKHVSDTNLNGLKTKIRCLEAGAVAAFSKFPNCPPAEDFLQFVR